MTVTVATPSFPRIGPRGELKFALGRLKILDEYREARAQGHEMRPVLPGPVTWLSLARASARRWKEVKPVIAAMVAAARTLRADVAGV